MNMSKSELLKAYSNDINDIKNRAKVLNLNENEINAIFHSCFPKPKNKSNFKYICKLIIILLLSILTCYILLNAHHPTSSIVLRNVQGLIYPGLKFVRYLSMPIIKRYTSLTALYDESCLLENPLFYVNDMECWPCENVYSVIDLTGFSNYSLYQSGIPYIFKTNQKPVSYKTIQQIYSNNSAIFNRDANIIKSPSSNINYARDLPDFDIESSDAHLSWRINRMIPARLIRPLFPRPHIISEWSGQSIERYIMMDGPKASVYTLPTFECSYIILFQGSGERTIILKPSKECRNNCRTVSVVLKESYALKYNWWYWRPISLPINNSTESSISYISSYC